MKKALLEKSVKSMLSELLDVVSLYRDYSI